MFAQSWWGPLARRRAPARRRRLALGLGHFVLRNIIAAVPALAENRLALWHIPKRAVVQTKL